MSVGRILRFLTATSDELISPKPLTAQYQWRHWLYADSTRLLRAKHAVRSSQFMAGNESSHGSIWYPIRPFRQTQVTNA